MSIFGSIMSAIFHHSAQAAPAPGGSAAKPTATGSGTAGHAARVIGRAVISAERDGRCRRHHGQDCGPVEG